MLNLMRRAIVATHSFFEWRSFGIVVTQSNLETIYHLVNSLIGQHTKVILNKSQGEIKVGNTALHIGSRVKFANDSVVVRTNPNSEQSFLISSIYFQLRMEEGGEHTR